MHHICGYATLWGMATEVSYLTTREVADEFKVDPSTVRRWVESEALPAVRLPGGHLRFRRSDLEALLSPERGDVA